MKTPAVRAPSARRLRYPDAFAPTVLAGGFVLAGYAGGLALLIAGGWLGFLPGVLLLTESMVIAAYLTHECAHNAVFADGRHNEQLGRVLGWITGACYGDYADIREKHMRHHVDRGDVIFLDFRPVIAGRPRLRMALMALEWAFVPATCLLMHALVLVLPFTTERYRPQRWRVIVAAAVRWPLFLALAWFAWPAALGYALAFSLCVIVLRTMDMHQHTYEVMVTLGTDRKGPPPHMDRAYEQRNTFSNPLGRGRFAKLLVLNFGFHNAHHERPALPWFRLPALHRQLFGDDETQVLPFRNVLRNYARFRVRRVMTEETGDMDVGRGRDKGMGIVGVYGVSFLTAF